MSLRAVLTILFFTSLGLCQNSNHGKAGHKSQLSTRRTHSSVTVPTAPKANAANKQLVLLEKDTARTFTAPPKTSHNQPLKAVPPIDKTPAKTTGKQRSAINFNYQQQRTSGHNTNTVPRPK